jgi:hypothetical protein
MKRLTEKYQHEVMKRKMPLLITLFTVMFFAAAFLTPISASAASPSPPTACNLKSGCDLVKTYLNPLINLLSVAFGLIAVISVIMGGIQYSASQGDPQKSAQARSRITNTVVAIFAYLFLYIFLQFLIPGGLFH